MTAKILVKEAQYALIEVAEYGAIFSLRFPVPWLPQGVSTKHKEADQCLLARLFHAVKVKG